MVESLEGLLEFTHQMVESLEGLLEAGLALDELLGPRHGGEISQDSAFKKTELQGFHPKP
jgi:hypothetical protein